MVFKGGIVKNDECLEMPNNVSKIELKDSKAMASEYLQIYGQMLKNNE